MKRKVGDKGGVREELWKRSWGSDPVSCDIWGQLTSLSLSFLIYKYYNILTLALGRGLIMQPM